MIGQCVALVTRHKGAQTIVVEPMESRRQLALQLGADAALDPRDNDLATEIARLTEDAGPRVVFEASGNARGIASTYDLVAHSGTIIQIGLCADAAITAPLAQIQAKDLTIKGFSGSSGVWPRALKFLSRHQIDLGPLASHEFRFSEASEAFEVSRDGAATLKVLMRP
jgi:L-iditol 2-dehydrogenase